MIDMKTKLITLAMLVLIGAATTVSAQDQTTAAIESLVRQQIEAQTAFDRAKLDSLVTEDYIEISPFGEFDPRAKMLDFYKPEQKPVGIDVKFELNEFSTRVYGKVGVVIVRIDYAMSKGGTPLPPRSIRGTFVCRQDKGKWKVASAQFTGIRSATPPK